MNHNRLIIIPVMAVCLGAGGVRRAHAVAACSTVFSDVQCNGWTAENGGLLCACHDCKPGYHTSTNGTGTRVYQGVTYTLWQNCEACPSCGTCVSDTDFRAAGTGYQVRTIRTCNCGCHATSVYRCAPNYYGTSSDGKSGCTQCPSNGQSSAGTGNIRGCYITGGSDTSGTFTFTNGACNYVP